MNRSKDNTDLKLYKKAHQKLVDLNAADSYTGMIIRREINRLRFKLQQRKK
jgi:hypothetical protein